MRACHCPCAAYAANNAISENGTTSHRRRLGRLRNQAYDADAEEQLEGISRRESEPSELAGYGRAERSGAAPATVITPAASPKIITASAGIGPITRYNAAGESINEIAMTKIAFVAPCGLMRIY